MSGKKKRIKFVRSKKALSAQSPLSDPEPLKDPPPSQTAPEPSQAASVAPVPSESARRGPGQYAKGTSPRQDMLRAFLTKLLTHPKSAAEVKAACKAAHFGAGSVYEVAHEMGIIRTRNGKHCQWSLPERVTADVPSTDVDPNYFPHSWLAACNVPLAEVEAHRYAIASEGGHRPKLPERTTVDVLDVSCAVCRIDFSKRDRSCTLPAARSPHRMWRIDRPETEGIGTGHRDSMLHAERGAGRDRVTAGRYRSI